VIRNLIVLNPNPRYGLPQGTETLYSLGSRMTLLLCILNQCFLLLAFQPADAIAQTQDSAATLHAVRRWALLFMFLLLGLLIVITAWIAWQRFRHSREPKGVPKPPTKVIPNAWVESGKRMPVPPTLEEPDTPQRLAGRKQNDPKPPLQAEKPHDPDADTGALPDQPSETPSGRLRRAGRASGTDRPSQIYADGYPTSSHMAPVALVTGGSKRVGRSICLELAKAGCDIVITFNKSREDASALAGEISQMGRIVWLHELDLGNPDAVTALGRELGRTLPRLDILVHNASVFNPSPLADFDATDAAHIYQVNALGPLQLTAGVRTLLEHSGIRGGGCIIALTDIHADGRPRRNYAPYLMSKAALDQMVQCLARDLAPRVRVNAVALGVVAWPEDESLMTPNEQQRYVQRIPLGRPGDPVDAASAVRWLALEATYVTGTTVRVDGGRWLA
jgi:pteridine reductase